jgi:AcrR family transcriptional regulator
MVQERRDTQVRRRQIISAARKLIVKYGSEHVTVRRMAKEIGVSEGAIYRHFKSKRDVLSFLVDDIENTLIADIDKNYVAGVSALETLERVISDHMSSIAQRKGMSFQVIAEIISLGDKRLNKKVYDVINKYIGRIRDILSEGVKTGAIRQDIDLDATATLFFGMTQGLVNVWALSNYSFNLEQRYASIWNIFREIIIKR